MQSCASCPLEAMKDFTKADVFHILSLSNPIGETLEREVIYVYL